MQWWIQRNWSCNRVALICYTQFTMEGLVCFHLIIIWTMVITLLPQNTESLTRWPEGRTVVPSSRVISTKKGSLRGLYVAWEDKSMSPVEMFLGVPYASPPVGSLRFMPPATVSPWRSTRTTDRYSPVCPQHFPDIANETEALKRMPRGRLEALKKLKPLLANQSEDCLYLNIYAPYTSKTSVNYSQVFLHIFRFIHVGINDSTLLRKSQIGNFGYERGKRESIKAGHFWK